MTYKPFAVRGALLALAAGSLLAAAPASADTHDVTYDDLDLTTSGGERALNSRVKLASGMICRQALGPGGNASEGFYCRVASWRDARPQVRKAVTAAREMAANERVPKPPIRVALAN